MMCVHGDAGLGKTLSVNAALRALAPAEVCRVQFRARPTPRDIRHVLFDALGIGGGPRRGRSSSTLFSKTFWLNDSGCWYVMRRSGCRGSVSSCGATCGTTGAPRSRSCSSAAATAIGCCAANRCSPAGCTSDGPRDGRALSAATAIVVAQPQPAQMTPRGSVARWLGWLFEERAPGGRRLPAGCPTAQHRRPARLSRAPTVTWSSAQISCAKR